MKPISRYALVNQMQTTTKQMQATMERVENLLLRSRDVLSQVDHQTIKSFVEEIDQILFVPDIEIEDESQR